MSDDGPWVEGDDGIIYYNDGNVGVGTANPAALMHLNAAHSDFSGSYLSVTNAGIGGQPLMSVTPTGSTVGVTLTSDTETVGVTSQLLISEGLSGVTTDQTAHFVRLWDGMTSGNLPNAYGQFIAIQKAAGSGTITSVYGLYIAAVTAATNNFAIYCENGVNYFGGNVGIGTTPSAHALDVAGDGNFSGGLTANGAQVYPGVFTGDSGSGGAAGAVPAPAAGDAAAGKFLSAGGGWAVPPVTAGVSSFNTRTGAVTPQSGDYTAAQVGLGNVTDDTQLKASQLDTDPSLAADADDRVPSQKAVKTYVDSHVGGFSLMGAEPVTDFVQPFATGQNNPHKLVDVNGALFAPCVYTAPGVLVRMPLNNPAALDSLTFGTDSLGHNYPHDNPVGAIYVLSKGKIYVLFQNGARSRPTAQSWPRSILRR